MEVSGESEIEGVSAEEIWRVLSDPVAIQTALPRCEFFVRAEDEVIDFGEYESKEGVETLPEADPDVVADRTFREGEEYAALITVSVGTEKREFEARVNVDERDYPVMCAKASGASSESEFEITSSMTISETEAGTQIGWNAEPVLSGQLAQMDRRVLVIAANDIVNRFFGNIEALVVETEGTENEDGRRDGE